MSVRSSAAQVLARTPSPAQRLTLAQGCALPGTGPRSTTRAWPMPVASRQRFC